MEIIPSEVTLQLVPLNNAQQEILNSPARFRVVACGRRFGKTTLAKEEIIDAVTQGQRVAYFAPTMRNAGDLWRDIKQTLAPITLEVNEHDMVLFVVGGGLLEVWSLSSSSAQMMRGRKYHRIIVDEAAWISNLLYLWHGALRPTLTDYRGRALFLSTPNGIDGFYELYSKGLTAQDGWASFNFPTTQNPYISPEEIEDARRDMPDRAFRQEYMAEFLTDGGMVFRGVYDVCTAERQLHRDNGRYVFGVDWGRSDDFTAVSVMDTFTMRQVELDRFNQVSWSLQYGRLRTLYNRYRPHVILAETNSIGDVNIEMLQEEGLPVRGFTTTARSKPVLIDTLALAIERKEVVLLNDPILKAELVAYRMDRTQSGWSYSAPSGGHDDTVIATALSLHAAMRSGGLSIAFA